MYLPPSEMKIIKSMRKEWEEYIKKFGKPYAILFGLSEGSRVPKDGKSAIEIWREGLLKALETGIPYEWIPEEHTLDI